MRAATRWCFLVTLLACGGKQSPGDTTPAPGKTEAVVAPAPAATRTVLPLRPAPMTAPMSGPFASIDDYCDARTADESGEDSVTCSDPSLSIIDPTPCDPVPPILEVRTLATEALDFHCHVALRTAAGWYVQAEGVECGSSRAKANISIETEALSLRDVTGDAAPELLFRYAIVSAFDDTWFCVDDCDQAKESENRFQGLVVCGFGALGTLSCTEPIDLGFRRTERPSTLDATRPRQSATLQIDVAARTSFHDGVLFVDIEPVDPGEIALAREALDHAGRYPISFP